MNDVTPGNASALVVLLLLAAAGHKVRIQRGGLQISRRAALSPELIQAIERNKAELLAMVGEAR